MKRGGITKVGYVSFNHLIPDNMPTTHVVKQIGPFDKSEGQPGRFLPMDLTANGITKAGVLSHSPSGGGHTRYTYGKYQVKIPADGETRLEFATGLAIKRYPGMDGVTFEVFVTADDREGSVFRVHQRSIDWQQRVVDLKEYAGKDVSIEWRTCAGPKRSTTVADWGAWGEPRLVVHRGGKAQTLCAFAKSISVAETGICDPGWSFVYNDATIRRYIGLPLLKGPVVTTPYFALKLQSMLSGTELPVTLNGAGGITEDEAAGMIAAGDGNKVTILLWTFDLGHDGAREFSVALEGMAPGRTYRLKQYLVDSTHSNPYFEYVLQGKSSNDGRYNLETGDVEVVRQETVVCPETGQLEVRLDLTPMAVSLLELTQQ